jgi:hypothetical protein
MTRGRMAWAIALGDMVATIVVAIVVPGTDASAVLWFAVIALFTTIGAVLISRVPANRIGVMFLAAGTIQTAAAVFGGYAEVGRVQTPPLAGADLARTVGDILFFYPIVIALIGIPLVFPDGRLPSSRFRWVAVIAVLDPVAWTLNAGLGWSLDAVVFVSTITAFVGAAIAVGVRFRRGDRVQRQQVKWLAADAALAAILFPLAFLMPDPELTPVPALALAVWLLAVLTMVALPIVIAIAILRYRLYEIDRIVSRTIGWAVVSGVLVAVFAGAVIALQAALSGFTQGQTLAVAASTLVAFALFQPVRRRVQRAVDRRFDRARYDGERTTAAFGLRLRDEVDLATVTGDLTQTARVALAPTALGVWLRGHDR